MNALITLFGSEAKVKVLDELLTHCDDAYHLRGLAKAAGVDSSNLKSLLNRLIDSQLVLLLDDKRGIAYRINKASPMFNALKQLFTSATQFRKDLEATAASLNFAELVLLFGSVAKGTDTATSDVDVLVVARDISSIEAQMAFADLRSKHNRDINVVTISPENIRTHLSSGFVFWTEIWDYSITLKGDKNAYI